MAESETTLYVLEPVDRCVGSRIPLGCGYPAAEHPLNVSGHYHAFEPGRMELRPATSEEVAGDDATRHQVAALRGQASRIRQRIRTHGAGMRHGCDTGRSNYCDAWRIILADTEAQIRALEEGGAPTQLNVESVDEHSTEAAREAAHLEVMTNFAVLRREANVIKQFGLMPTGVLIPARLNVPYDGPDATDEPARLMHLPVRWGAGEHWGMVFEPEALRRG